MPIKPTSVKASAHQTGKDQGRVTVTYRHKNGTTTNARVIGVANPATAPAAPTVAPQGTAGTTTYRYQITAVDASGNESLASAGGQTTTGNAALSGTNFNRVTWGTVSGASSYNLYGRSGADGTTQFIANVTGTTYDDKGTVTPSGTIPSAPSATSLSLLIGSGPNRRKLTNVPLATSYKQVRAYVNRN